MSVPLPMPPLRVLASRAVLAHGFDTRQLMELPHPPDIEMEAYGKLQGTYHVKSTIIKIEQVLPPLSVDYAAEKAKTLLATTNLRLVKPGQNIEVNRLSNEEWAVKIGLRVSRFPLRNPQRVITRGKRVHMCCHPEDGRLEKTRSITEYLQQHTLQLDSRGSLVWTYKDTHKVLTFTWTCRASRLRRSFRTKKK